MTDWRNLDSPAAVDGWNHSAHYHGALLAVLPLTCRRALDVGCGLGSFARRLAPLVEQVDALDRDANVVERARALTPGLDHVNFVTEDFLAWRSHEPYDFVAMIAVLHHLPFEAALDQAKSLLRPGGVLGVIGLDRARAPLEALARNAIAWPVSVAHRLTRPASEVGAPIAEPTMTLDEIRARAAPILPGAAIRRRLLWRYTLLWAKPGSA